MKEKRTKSQIGRGSKNKGKGYERKIAKLIGAWFCPDEMNRPDKPDRIRRTPTSGVIFSGDVFDKKYKLPFVIECKKRSHLSFSTLLRKDSELWKFWEQTLGECGKYIPFLIFSENYGPDNFMLDSKVFSEMEDWGGKYSKGFLKVKNFDQEQNVVVGLLKDFLDHFSSENLLALKGIEK